MSTRRSWATPSGVGVLVTLLVILLSVAAPVAGKVDREITPEEAARLEEWRAEVEKNGYDWEVGPTSVSHLSHDEFQQRLGDEVPAHIQAIYDTLKPDPAIERMQFRSSFDWRDYGGVTPAKDQGACGSCWAFAAVGAVEAGVLIHEDVFLDLSEQQLIDCNDSGSDCDGGQCVVGYSVMVDPGAVEEECMPYLADEGTCRERVCEKVAIVDGDAFIPNTVASIKNAVETYGPVSTSLYADDDLSGYTAGCYENPSTAFTNHAVIIIGWDDAMCGGQGAWLIKNSWGPGWGFNGFGYLKYGTCRIGSNARRPVNPHVPKTRLVPDEFATIQSAIDNSERGDVIRVAGGTYNENLVLGELRMILGGHDPTFTVRDPELYPTIIDGGNVGSVIECLNLNAVRIDGFEIRNSGPLGYGVYLRNTEAKVQNCYVHDCWRGIGVVTGTTSATDGEILIQFNEVANNTAHGIFINAPPNPVVKVYYTAIHDNGGTGIYSGQSVTALINNTVASNAGNGGIEILSSPDVTILNNIVASNTGNGILCTSAAPAITYNDVWDNSLGDYSGCSGGDGSMSVDPIFCNAASGIVSVHATSPTLGAGEYGWDMGALGIGCPIGPQELEVIQDGASLDLAWSPPPPEERADVDYYIVYRDTTQVATNQVATVDAPDTTFTDITIPACLSHYYRVSAVDLGGLEGAPSSKVSAELCYDGPYDLDVLFSEGANEMSWSQGDGPIEYYVIQRSTIVDEPDSVGWVASGVGYFIDTAVADCPRDNYSYEILPVYDTGWRGEMTGKVTIDPAPSPPAGIVAEWVGPDVVLTWDHNCEADFRRYWVYRDTVPLAPPPESERLIGFLAETTFVDEGPNPNKTWFYRLAATDADAQRSRYSEQVYLGTGTTLTVPAPYTTIQEAITAASALDTVAVGPGTYEESIVLKDGVFVVSTDGPATTTITWPGGTSGSTTASSETPSPAGASGSAAARCCSATPSRTTRTVWRSQTPPRRSCPGTRSRGTRSPASTRRDRPAPRSEGPSRTPTTSWAAASTGCSISARRRSTPTTTTGATSASIRRGSTARSTTSRGPMPITPGPTSTARTPWQRAT